MEVILLAVTRENLTSDSATENIDNIDWGLGSEMEDGADKWAEVG